MKRRRQIIVLVITVLVLGTGAGLLFRPAAIPVEAVSIGRGELLESVEEEGKTRMHDHFSVAAPVAGMLRRIDLHAGDRVRAGQRLAWIDPAPIDPREKAVLDARLNAARATHRQAEAQASRSKADYVQAELDLNRNRQLFRDGIISKEMLERQITLHDTAAKQLQAAQSAVDAAEFQVEEARSALLLNKDRPSDVPTPIRSPVGGRVLRLFEQSERVVVTGTPLLEIGYMPRLEVVTDFLTRDAVRIQPGMPALLIDWGGDAEIPAHVREVEPGGFTKISALGVEEQRVNVVCDLDAPANGLQDGYHANVRVITWQDKDVLQVPSSAVYRSAGEWKVFIVQEGRAVRRTVRIGHRGDASWESLAGWRLATVSSSIPVPKSTRAGRLSWSPRLNQTITFCMPDRGLSPGPQWLSAHSGDLARCRCVHGISGERVRRHGRSGCADSRASIHCCQIHAMPGSVQPLHRPARNA